MPARPARSDATTLDEPLAQAACGLMAVHGRARGPQDRGRGVTRLGVDYVTTAAGLALAHGALTGLLARHRGATVDGVAFELETLDAEPWRRLWTSLGISDAVAGRAWRPFMLRYATALAPLPAELPAAVAARSFTELIHTTSAPHSASAI